MVDQYVNALSFNHDTASDGACANPASATCMRGQGAVYLFNGATGALIRRTDDPVPQAGVQWGAQDAEPLGDVDGDGVADYDVNAPLQAGPSGEPGAGRSWVFSGAAGTVLYEVKDPTPTQGGAFGFSMTRTDYDRDGTNDLYIGQNPHHRTGATTDTSGGTYVFDGRDGSLLKSLELPPSDAQPGADGNLGSLLGWTVVAPGDLNGDGEPDYVAGAPTTDVGPSAFNCQAPIVGCVKDVGRQYFFLSRVPVPAVAPAPVAPAPVAPAPAPAPAPGRSVGGLVTAKLSLARATISRRDRVLDVLAPITSLASGGCGCSRMRRVAAIASRRRSTRVTDGFAFGSRFPGSRPIWGRGS